MRIGVIGARRADQGIGQYVAGHLASLGAEVAAIVGTSTDSIAAAAAELQRQYGLRVVGYSSVREMLEAASLDAVAICSPQQFHAEQLQLALKHRVHVLCEKPLVFTPGTDNLAAARPLVDGFDSAGLVLMVNQQWPYTLSAFDRCWPEARRQPLTQLEMLMAPSEDGPAMIPNTMPHVLSLLLSCAPAGGRVDRPRVVRRASGVLEVVFQYVHSAGQVAVQTWLIQAPRQPRPAGYAINGSSVLRKIRTRDYAMFFETGATPLGEIALAGPAGALAAAACDETSNPARLRRIPLEDPLRLLLADFISCTRADRSAPASSPSLLDGVRLLDALYVAAVEQLRS